MPVTGIGIFFNEFALWTVHNPCSFHLLKLGLSEQSSDKYVFKTCLQAFRKTECLVLDYKLALYSHVEEHACLSCLQSQSLFGRGGSFPAARHPAWTPSPGHRPPLAPGICTRVHTRTHLHTHGYTQTRACRCTQASACKHTYTPVLHMCTCTFTHTHVCIHVCVRVHAHTLPN